MSKGNKPENSKDETGALLEITRHARDEIDRVEQRYRLIGTLLALVIAVGIWFTYQNVRDFKEDIRQEGQRAIEVARREQKAFEEQQRQYLIGEVERVRTQVVNRIETEFASERITSLVSNEAQRRIDTIADRLINEAVTARITPIEIGLSNRLQFDAQRFEIRLGEMDQQLGNARAVQTNLLSTLEEAKATLKSANQRAEFFMTALSAETDDRSAYEQLSKWANDSEYPMRQEAIRVRDSIVAATKPDMPAAVKQIPWRENIKPETFDAEQMQSVWNGLDGDFGWAFVQFVRGHTNLSLAEKMKIYNDIATNSHNSLLAAHHAAAVMSVETKYDYNSVVYLPEAVRAWEKWVQTNVTSNSITNGSPASIGTQKP